jgi:hypothetical protein
MRHVKKEITFYRTCLNSSHQPYDSPMLKVSFPLSVREADALQYAQRELEQFYNRPSWLEIADFYRFSVAA